MRPPADPAGAPPVRLQPLARAKAATLGDTGARWVAGLPAVLAELAARWDLQLGRPVPGGSASYVVRARTRTGEERVLKLGMPDPALAAAQAEEARVLAAARGRAYAVLHAHDPHHRALLLEALGGSLALDPGPRDAPARLALLAGVLHRAWEVPGVGAPPPPGEDRACVLHRQVLVRAARLGLDADVLEDALEAAERRAAAYDPTACVVVHGDPHPANLLRVPATGAPPPPDRAWVLVDPGGGWADPASDLGVVVRDGVAELAGLTPAGARGRVEGWCALLADLTGADASAAWDWGLVERVATGLYVLGLGSAGSRTLGRGMLDSAALLCR